MFAQPPKTRLLGGRLEPALRRHVGCGGICRGVFGYLFAEKRYKTPATSSRLSLYFCWQPTHAARAETACGLCHARRRKTSVAKLKVPKPSACRFSREQPPARVERAQQEQDYAASRSGHAGCRLFFLRCKRECGGLKPLPGAIVGFCASCLFRTHPSRHVPRRTTPAWQKRRSKRCGLKARAEGTVCLQTRE